MGNKHFRQTRLTQVQQACGHVACAHPCNQSISRLSLVGTSEQPNVLMLHAAYLAHHGLALSYEPSFVGKKTNRPPK
jgi:hypothetical protein